MPAAPTTTPKSDPAPGDSDRQLPDRGGLHPFIGSTFSNWMRVRWRYSKNIAPGQWKRRALITLSTAIGAPIRWIESLRMRSRIRKLDMPPPVFIVGHWRSGTTNFHNHMLQDPQFGYVSLLHCLLAPSFVALGKQARGFMKDRLPATRPMDAVPVGLDEPMSEDFAMTCLSEFTHYHRYFFPESNDEIFRRTIFFEGLSDADIRRWHKAYDYLLRKVSVVSGGKRLVLKNPPHVGRIRHLVKFYPDAKFVHVYRNPYEVFVSTRKLMQKFLKMFSFQPYSLAELEENVLVDYARIMRRFFEDEHLIPEENYIRVRHEDVVRDGVGTLEQVYAKLQLPGFEEMRPRLEEYVRSISDYQTNTYEFSDELLTRIRQHCGFAIDKWGYEPPGRMPRNNT